MIEVTLSDAAVFSGSRTTASGQGKSSRASGKKAPRGFSGTLNRSQRARQAGMSPAEKRRDNKRIKALRAKREAKEAAAKKAATNAKRAATRAAKASNTTKRGGGKTLPPKRGRR